LQVLRRLNRIERKYQLIHSSDGKYRFDHSKIREVLYQAIAPELRREYHSLIAENLEKSYQNHLDDEINQLAYHYYKSSNSQKAIPYLIKAGKKSRKQYTLFETIRFFSQALEMMKDDEQWQSERTETLEALGDLYGFVAEHELANDCYIKGIANTDDKLAKDRMQKKIRRKRIVENKGVKLSYYVYGEGDPTILLVSWTSSTELWIPQVTYFSQKYTVVTFDMRGTGESDKPLGEYTVDVHVEDLNVIIDDLRVKNIIMVGAHYGGKIAVTYVTKYPGKISKLVLLGFLPSPFSEVANKEKFEKYREMALKSPSWFVNGFWTSAFSGQGFESLIEWGIKSSQRTPPEIFRDGVYSIWSVDVRPLLERINVPTLIIGGNKNANDLAQVMFLQEKIRKSKIHVFEDRNSVLLNIFAANEFNQTVENYIKTNLPKK
jgi:3-oxoadipate enol-lactonase